MQQLKTIIIEDEPKSAELMEGLLKEYCPELHVAAIAANIEEAFTLINRFKPSLIFLDIEMPEGSGFDLLEMFPQVDFHIIFTTSYDHYAIRAIRFSALDYLLKPINIVDLRIAVNRILNKQSPSFTSHASHVKSHSFKVALPCLDGFRMVSTDKILYCESSSNYTYFHLCGNEKILVTRTLKDCEELLEEQRFFRIHQSYLVNIDFIQKYNKGSGGLVIMENNVKLPVASRKKADFLDKLMKL